MEDTMKNYWKLWSTIIELVGYPSSSKFSIEKLFAKGGLLESYCDYLANNERDFHSFGLNYHILSQIILLVRTSSLPVESYLNELQQSLESTTE
jgi:hypothetical protein